MKKYKAGCIYWVQSGNNYNIKELMKEVVKMNIKIYEFESHKNKQSGLYYKETLYKNDYCFYILFEGNKGSKYGFQKGYKNRVGRKGRIEMSLENTKEWILEKKAETREFSRATFKIFKKNLLKANQEQKDKLNTDAWLYYIKNNAV